MAELPPHVLEVEVIDQFLAAMQEHQIDIDESIIADGKLHRYHVAGDKARSRNGWAVLHIDERPAGKFGCNKRFAGEHFSWTIKGSRPLTPDERRELKETARARAEQRQAEREMWQANAAQRALAIYEEGQPVTEHPYLTLKGVPSSPKLRLGNWYRIDEETGEEILVSDRALIVPMMDPAQRIHSLQAILDGSEGGFRKQYLKHGAKEAKFLSIGKPRDNTILICEGLATGLSLWQCTAHAVLVAFDAGNLLAVAKEARRVFPDATIMLCADNDAWTDKPVKNPGIHYANAAALAINGLVAYPEFQNTETKPTDFNDLHQLQGEAIVRETIDRALAPPVEAPETTLADEVPLEPQDLPSDTPSGDGDEGLAKNPHFTFLGFSHGTYNFFSYEQRQVLSLTSNRMNDAGFIELAPLKWWQENFRSSNEAINKKGAMEFLIRTSHRHGIFNSENVRGRGAWLDASRSVFNNGIHLVVDGKRTGMADFRSKYVYEASWMLFETVEERLSDDEGTQILELIRTWNWEEPLHADLAAGWTVLAAICGALKWRPHIWVTGGSATGKSTLVGKVINRLLSGIALFVQAATTEAGIRQTLGCDARPVIFDEAESGDEQSHNRINNVISLMRQASSDTGANILKGTQAGKAQRYSCRSAFLMSAIAAPIIQEADSNRITVLSLKPRDTTAAEDEGNLQLIWRLANDDRLSARFLNRVLENLPVITQNVDTFTRVAARRLFKRRDADQLGALLAGAWALTSTELAREEDAAEMLARADWAESRPDSAGDEGERVLQTIARQRVKDKSNCERVVAQLIATAAGTALLDASAEDADLLLQSHGLRVMPRDSGWKLLVAKNHEAVRTLAKGSGFESDPWRQLARIPGAHMPKQKEKREKERFAGNPCRYVEIPIECALGEEWETALISADPISMPAGGEENFVRRHPRAIRDR
jgi:putative DNA primase/helicase